MEILWRSFDFFASFSFFAQSLPVKARRRWQSGSVHNFLFFLPAFCGILRRSYTERCKIKMGLLKKLFGTSSEKELKAIAPIVNRSSPWTPSTPP